MPIFYLPVLLSAHAEDQRAEAKALREEVRSIHEEERDDESKKSFKISKASDSQEELRKKDSTKSTSKASSRSMSKDSSAKEVVSNGFAHIAIGKEDEPKQKTVQGSPDRLPNYEAEDKVAAEKLLQTTYREKKATDAKKSEGERGATF